MSIKAKIGKGALKLLRWMGLTLAREAVDLIVDKTTKHEPVAKIVPHEQFVVASQFRDRMMTHPDELAAELKRLRGQQP